MLLSASCETRPVYAAVPTVAGWFTIASATDSIIGQPLTKALEKTAAKMKARLRRKKLPDCLNVQGNAPCVIGRKP